jgi:23S rRNA (adenine2030-N6)-methyltransferase
MFAYRHAFHAGMHADVLKHLVLTQILSHLAEKDKGYTYLDTHAGAGHYSLSGPVAYKTAEFQQGIARLWARRDAPLPVANYLALVRRHNGPGALAHYPGSPEIARMMRRPQDRLRLYELHPTDHRLLFEGFGREPNAQVACSDGFAAVKADWPPPTRRGVLLIDPSYEIKSDYPKVHHALRDALARFAPGVVMIWYPQLLTRDAIQLPQRLRALADEAAPKGWLHAQLTVQSPDDRGFGLVGSGVFVVNPPFVLHEAMRIALPYLVKALAQVDDARFVLEQRTA